MTDNGSVASAVIVSGLTKRFGRVTAVDDVSLEIPAGGVFGLLGPNGSGKTTMLAMLAGFIRPTAGEIILLGQSSANGQRAALAGVGTLIERPIFWPYLSCRDNLKCLQGVYASDGGPAEIDELLVTVGLDGDASRRKFRACSTGMKQRLGIAATLLGNPSLLILDEPTNGLDPAGIVEVRELVRNLSNNGRRTVILASHLLNEVEQVCDSVGILSHGRLIAQGDVAELLQERGQPQVRLRTTDDRKAWEILNALAWVDSVSADNGYLVAGVDAARSWEITAALSRNEVYVSEMTPAQMSLEQYFLDVTEGEAI